MSVYKYTYIFTPTDTNNFFFGFILDVSHLTGPRPYVQICNIHMYTFMYICKYIYLHIYMYIHLYVCIYMYIYICTYNVTHRKDVQTE